MDISAEELSIPVPWGTVAARAWGRPELPRVLAVHGLSDNAGAFDQLMPRVCGRMRVVCVDLPGHGRSSPLPPGLPPCLLHHVWALRLLTEHLDWPCFGLMAHSIGSHIALYLAAVFPHSVSRVLLIDAFFVNVTPEDFVLERTQMTFDKLAKLEPRERPLSFEQSLRKLREDRQSGLGERSALALHARAFRLTPKGYVYNNDPRLKMLTYPLTCLGCHLGLLGGVACRILVLSTSAFEPFLSLPVTERSLAELRARLGPRMRVVRVHGSHDIHMDQPQAVADTAVQFLTQIESHL